MSGSGVLLGGALLACRQTGVRTARGAPVVRGHGGHSLTGQGEPGWGAEQGSTSGPEWSSDRRRSPSERSGAASATSPEPKDFAATCGDRATCWSPHRLQEQPPGQCFHQLPQGCLQIDGRCWGRFMNCQAPKGSSFTPSAGGHINVCDRQPARTRGSVHPLRPMADLGMAQSLCHLPGFAWASRVPLARAKSRLLGTLPTALQVLKTSMPWPGTLLSFASAAGYALLCVHTFESADLPAQPATPLPF